MRALVTGITGFIGSHVGELLVSQGHSVLGTGGSGCWRADAPPSLVEQVSLRAWDITQPAPPELQREVEDFDPDTVFHFAGLSIPSRCGGNVPTAEAVSANVHGTRHVLDLAVQLSALPKFIFVSTAHVYARVDRSHPFVNEDSAVAPVSAYGQTKRACELDIQGRAKTDGLRTCIVRGFHHIGPRQPEGLMLTDWLGQLKNPDCTDLIVRSTNSYLDLMDVRDGARAFLALAEDCQAQGVYNLGSGKISRSGDVLRAILKLMDKRVNVIERSSAEQWNAIADITKLQALGWEPTTTCQQTIASMLGEP